MQFDKTRVPKEIYQKETIAIHIPKINRPLTYRQLYFILPGFFISLLIQFVWGKLFALPSNGEDRVTTIAIRVMVFIFIIVMVTIIATFKKDGKYLEEILFRKVNYSRKSSVMMNEKALRTIKSNNKK